MAVLACTASRTLAAPCLDGRFLVTGASPLGLAGTDSEVIELVGGSVAMRGGCPLAPAVVSSSAVQTRVRVGWPACGLSERVVLRARITGIDCRTLRGSVRFTRDGKRRTRRVRASRVKAVNAWIVPKPVAAWQPIEGGSFIVTPDTAVLVEPDRPDVTAVAAQLVALLQRQGLALSTIAPLRGKTQPRNSLLLTTEDGDPSLGREGYALRVTSSRVVLRAPSSAGLFYAVQSLRQLLPVALDGPSVAARTWSMPAIAVDDRPRFAWRGFMLDVSRTFYSIEWLRRWVDLLALHKLNVFQLHLTDDQGWRLESEAFPALHLDGSRFDPVFRNEVGGYYTTAELSDLVAYAAARNIEIVPEIDVPGHAGAMLHALPNLACETTPAVPRLASEFPIVPCCWLELPPLCVCDPGVLATIGVLLDEIVAIFPSRFIHLGGDEVESATWSTGYLCAGVIAAHGLDGVGDLQAWFTQQLEQMVRARDRVLIGWDEVHEHERPGRPSTTLSTGFTTMHWRAEYAAPTLFDRDVVQAVDDPLYLDLDFGSPRDAYFYDPIPPGATAAQAAHVLGLQASMWTNRARTEIAVDRRVFPRLGAVAETAWTPLEQKSWTDFTTRWGRHVERLDLLGVAR